MAFTLIELLVVVSIIALLISILLPSLRSARDSAKRVVCKANLHSLGVGFAIYAEAHNGQFPASYSLWDAPWGIGDIFWHQRLIEEGLALGKNSGPKRNHVVCPSDEEPWTPYTFTNDEQYLFNASYGANPIALIVDGKNAIGQQEPDGVHDWNFWPYQGVEHARVDRLRWPAHLVLVTEVEGPITPFFFDPWLPNLDEVGKDGEWHWARHDRSFNGQTGGFVNLLHGDSSVSQSRVNQAVVGLADGGQLTNQARRQMLPGG
ncbi:MAG: prepilin-type N-terminal cleavage/methylation domain-containing protein [bacterium]|nr:prepilin-type N-terminal cleavage/methylation domain-containing protein [bacterium]